MTYYETDAQQNEIAAYTTKFFDTRLSRNQFPGRLNVIKLKVNPVSSFIYLESKWTEKTLWGGGGRGSESKGWRGKIGNQSTVLSSIVAVSFFSDLSCITDKIVDAPHLELYLKSTSGRRDGFGFNLLFHLEMNISCRECGQDNISKLSPRYITSWSSPRWNIAVGV